MDVESKNRHWIILGFLISFDLMLWGWLWLPTHRDFTGYYFLNVGQGDAELLVFEGGVKLLIDGGPGHKVLDELAKVLSTSDRYIDLVLMTHPQQDHIEGLVGVLKSYRVGAFLGTGRKAQIGSYGELMDLIKEKKIPYIALKEGDQIKYGKVFIKVISPSTAMLGSVELNDTSLVILVEDNGIKSIFTGDAGENIENLLVKKYELNVDMLKVGHHGSRFSSSFNFLSEMTPAIAIIEVGRNHYGHPAQATLQRLKAIQSKIYRTDELGTLKVSLKNKILKVEKLRS